jgi:cyclohexyl-isocyanide hydratase
VDKGNISRRSFATGIGVTLATSTLLKPASAASKIGSPALSESAGTPPQKGNRLQIGMLLFPALTPLDLVGPQIYFASLPNSDVHLLWKDKNPVATAHGYSIVPTLAIKDCPRDLDVLFVPGGAAGTATSMEDDGLLSFLADRGSRARYVTSVCTGSLILGAAGLLKGYKATCHWRFRDLLPMFGATPVEERIVTDGNRITGGGVTAGIDFGLAIAADLSGQTRAQAMQLATEYDPHPPFASGSPKTAPSDVKEMVFNGLRPAHDRVQAAAEWARRSQNIG